MARKTVNRAWGPSERGAPVPLARSHVQAASPGCQTVSLQNLLSSSLGLSQPVLRLMVSMGSHYTGSGVFQIQTLARLLIL